MLQLGASYIEGDEVLGNKKNETKKKGRKMRRRRRNKKVRVEYVTTYRVYRADRLDARGENAYRPVWEYSEEWAVLERRVEKRKGV